MHITSSELHTYPAKNVIFMRRDLHNNVAAETIVMKVHLHKLGHKCYIN